MPKPKNIQIIDVNAGNVDETGFFCYMSKRKSEGYQRKLNWLKERFGEGMRMKLLGGGLRGFIEYIPGEYAWRAFDAKGYMFIHCLWVVGQCKKKGYGSLLLDACIKDAKKSGVKGVAMVTSEGNFLASKKLLEKSGFESVAESPPSFNMMVMKFKNARDPKFTGDWEKKAKQYGKGLTVLRTDQCPYNILATDILLDAAGELGIKRKVVEVGSCKEIRDSSPSPFGVFNVIYNGRLLSYHYLSKKDFKEIVKTGK